MVGIEASFYPNQWFCIVYVAGLDVDDAAAPLIQRDCRTPRTVII